MVTAATASTSSKDGKGKDVSLQLNAYPLANPNAYPQMKSNACLRQATKYNHDGHNYDGYADPATDHNCTVYIQAKFDFRI